MRNVRNSKSTKRIPNLVDMLFEGRAIREANSPVTAQDIADHFTDELGGKFTVTDGSVEQENGQLKAFDLDYNGVKYDGGSYIIANNGDIINSADQNRVMGNIKDINIQPGMSSGQVPLTRGEFTLQDLKKYIKANRKQILANQKAYGYTKRDIVYMKSYVDLASLLGIDSRLLKDVDMDEYATTAAALI